MESISSYRRKFREGFVNGIGFSFGATVGFAIISTLLVLLFQILGGLPLIGTFVADIVTYTQASLVERTPILK